MLLRGNIPISVSPGKSRELLLAVKYSSVLWLIGGGYFHDAYTFTSIICKGMMIITFKLLNKKVAMTGAGLFKYRSKAEGSAARYLFKMMDLLSVRDNGDSIKTLRSLGISRYSLSSDDSLYILSKNIGQKIHDRRKYAVISLHGKFWNNVYALKIEKLLRTLHIEHHLKIYFMPHSNNDKMLLVNHVMPMAKRLKIEHAVFDAEAEGVENTIRLVSNAKITISSRFHLVVVGISQRIPSIAISHNNKYRSKFMGFLEQFGLQKYCINSEDLNDIPPFIKSYIAKCDHFNDKVAADLKSSLSNVMNGFGSVKRMAGNG
jgi:polysaccharide pyruvyl transferase WcaK-like protein